jgi:lipoprotein-anchoring transpeptidase ErfK/SrfK
VGKLSASSRDPVLQQYAISAADLKGPFTERLPSKLEEMKDLPALGYRSAREAIAEKFHMSEELLTALNPGKKFDAAGETIIVANVSNKISGKGARIEVDKSAETLKVFDGAGRLLAVYPATVGSEQKPAPDGTLRITSISRNPVYRYDPEYKFKGVKSQEPFTIRPGPNNPVGTGLDRALAKELRNSRNAASGESQQDRIARMRPADELGCRAGGEPDAKGIAGGVCGRAGGIERRRAEEGGVAEPQALARKTILPARGRGEGLRWSAASGRLRHALLHEGAALHHLGPELLGARFLLAGRCLHCLGFARSRGRSGRARRGECTYKHQRD